MPSRAPESFIKIVDHTQIDPENVMYGATTVHKTCGQYLHKRELFNEARLEYDEAYKYAPEDVEVLVGRSHTYSDLYHARQALRDATAACDMEPTGRYTLRALAEANHVKLELEKSLAISHVGHKLYPQNRFFQSGVSLGVAQVHDTIGENAGRVLTDFYPLIKKNERMAQSDEEPIIKTHVSRIPQPERSVKVRQIEIHKRKLLSRVLAFKYLGPMAYEKFYLENLAKDRRLESANKSGSQKLKELVDEALLTIDKRQEMLRTQCPYYAIKNKEKCESKHQIEFAKKLLETNRERNQQQANKMIHNIEVCLHSCPFSEVMKKAQGMQMFLDKNTLYSLPGKESYVERLYQAIGEGYLHQYRITGNHSDYHNRNRVAFLLSLKTTRPMSHDSVIANYPRKFVEPAIAVQKALDALEIVENDNMKCWLYYELARLECVRKNNKMSQFYAKMCQKEAEAIESDVWWLNGCFALISSDVQRGNVYNVQTQTAKAYEYAKRISNSEPLKLFLQKCTDVATEMAETDPFKEEKKRQKAIINVMDPTMRKDSQILFKKLSIVPPKRRFSVSSQMDFTKNVKPARKKDLQRNLSITGGPPKALPRLSETPIPGLQIIH